MEEELILRRAHPGDVPALVELYRAAAASGGLARSSREISETYISDFLEKALVKGLVFVLHSPEYPERLLGELHGYPLGLKTFAHVFEQVTMAVHPETQGQGLGKKLIQAMQQEIQFNWPHIMKVELKCFSNNVRALNLYQRCGFVVEGRQQNRVLVGGQQYADGISLAWFNPGFKTY